MTLRLRGTLAVTLSVLALGAVSVRGQAQGGDLAARQVIEAIGAEEAQARSGRLTLAVAERRGRLIEGEAAAAMRTRLESEPAVLAEGVFVHTPQGWLKDLQVAAVAGRPPSRTRTAQSAGTLRFAVDGQADGKPQTRALISGIAGTSPGDAVLSQGVAKALAGVEWVSVKDAPAEKTLSGTRSMERHTLVLGKLPRLHVRSWELSRSIPADDGKTLQHSYTCEVTWADGSESFQRVREWVVNPLGAGSVAYRDTSVRQREPLTNAAAASLAVPLPAGALVADARNGSPVEYELLDADPGDTPSPLTTDLQRTAPSFDVAGLGKKSHKLADYRKKPLLIAWFAAGSSTSASVSEVLDTLQEQHRKKGVQFLALEVAAGPDAERDAEAFRKSSGWSFPVALDPKGALLVQFGLRRAIPAVALVDADGKIVYGRAGLDPTTLSAALDVVKK